MYGDCAVNVEPKPEELAQVGLGRAQVTGAGRRREAGRGRAQHAHAAARPAARSTTLPPQPAHSRSWPCRRARRSPCRTPIRVPTPPQIATVSADTAASFGITPRVAMMSYSTGTSGSGPQVGGRRLLPAWSAGVRRVRLSPLPLPCPACSPTQVDKVKAATALVKEQRPDLFVEGERRRRGRGRGQALVPHTQPLPLRLAVVAPARAACTNPQPAPTASRALGPA